MVSGVDYMFVCKNVCLFHCFIDCKNDLGMLKTESHISQNHVSRIISTSSERQKIFFSLLNLAFINRYNYDGILNKTKKMIPALELDEQFITKEKELLKDETSGNSITR